MPTYVYETVSEPSERFEISQRMKDEPLTRHPDTGVAIRRVISGGLGYLAASDHAAPAPCGNPQPPAGGCGSGMCGHNH
jgi:hypothetical protein